MKIDLNSDLGEHFGAWRRGDDAQMMSIVSSANVPCGFHAGDPLSLLRTLERAAEHDVVVGAHVAYPDLVGFGRRRMDIASADLEADVIYQIGALEALARTVGTEVRYVKPHGALYNTIADDERQAGAVISAILRVNPELILLGLAGTPLIEQARAAGLEVVAEAFADRSYEPDGRLTSRSEPGSVLYDAEAVAGRMRRLVLEGVIEARDGSEITVSAESICVHGEAGEAAGIAGAIRRELTAAGVTIAPFVDRH